jgi:hypothetical protein
MQMQGPGSESIGCRDGMMYDYNMNNKYQKVCDSTM